MASDADLRDPDYAAGAILRLEKELADEKRRRRRDVQVRDDHDTLVSAALADVRDAVHDLQAEVVRQGGVVARTLRLAEAIVRHLQMDPDSVEPIPDVPPLRPMAEAERSLRELRAQRPPLDTYPEDVPVVAPARPPEAPPDKPSKIDALTPSFRPTTMRDWAKLATWAVLALGGVAAALRELVNLLK